jgi:RHS repeat-associated protein
LGIGWGIEGLSAIQRCRSTRESGDFLSGGMPYDGISPGITMGPTDRYCLDGQRIVLANGASAIYGAPGAHYALEADPFTRIELLDSDGQNGPDGFVVRRRDGSVSEYGSTADSYVNANDGGSTLRPEATSWALAKMRDSAGSYIRYEYEELAPSGPQGADHRIKRIHYTGKDNLPGQAGQTLPPFAVVEFFWDTPLSSPRTQRLAGSRHTTRDRLTKISSNGVRVYRLGYELSPSTGQDRLTSLRECWADNDLDCHPPTTFAWTDRGSQFSDAQYRTHASMGRLEESRFGDVDGDGRLDMVWVENTDTVACPTNQVRVAFFVRDANSRLDVDPNPADPGVCTQHDTPDVGRWWGLIDYDGDGRDDLLLAERHSSGNPAARWKIHPSIGRGFAPAVDLLTAAGQPPIIIPVVPEGASGAGAGQLSDFNGDGLADFMYRASTDTVAVRFLERAPGTTIWRFSDPYVVDLQVSQVHGCTDCTIAAQSLGSVYKPLDVNGDGQAEVEALLCAENPAPRPEGTLLQRVQESALATQPGCGLEHLHRPHVMQLVSREEVPTRRLVFEAYAEVPKGFMRGMAQAGDFNGDGAIDYVGLHDRFEPVPNTFPPQYTKSTAWEVCYGNPDAPREAIPTQGRSSRFGCAYLADETAIRSLHLVDLNQDGRSDLVYSNDNNATHRFKVRYASGDGVLAPPADLPAQALWLQSTNHPWRHWFQDLDSDGQVDLLAIQTGTNNNVRLVSGDAVHAARPVDLIGEISNGHGAKTRIDYLPLTNRSVYVPDQGSRRDADPASPETAYGRQSPLIDYSGATPVVSKVESDAPRDGAPTGTTRLYYRYAGAKLQAGGRGFLGFRAVDTIDGNVPGHQIISRTEYRQDFPFAGKPLRTRKMVVAQSFVEESCRAAGRWQTACRFVYDDTVSNNPPKRNDHTLPAHVLVQSAESTWQSLPDFTPGTGARAFLSVIALTDERAFDLTTGAALSVTLNGFLYDPFGNPTLTGTDICPAWPCNESNLVQRTRTINEYMNDEVRWWLGRLQSSTVQHTRRNPDTQQLETLARTVAFEYELGVAGEGARAGLLKAEANQPCASLPCGQTDPNKALAIRTLYDHDAFGNRVRSYTCSGDLTDVQCRDLQQLRFHPSDENEPPSARVHRTVRHEYDAAGRYLVASYEPAFDPNVVQRQWSERESMRVLSRDEFGEVLSQTDGLGMQTWTWRGELGRIRSVQSENGVETITTYRNCADLGAGGCPSRVDIRFREALVSNAGPATWIYRDPLGREALKVSRTGNTALTGKRLSGVCTHYDAYGRVSRVSEPFFLSDGSASGPSFSGDPCAMALHHRHERRDVLGRTIEIENPDGSKTLFTYNGLQVVRQVPDNQGVSGPNTGRTWTEERDAAGQLLRVTDPDGFEVSYRRWPSGEVREIRRDAGRGEILNLAEYDALGRLVRIIDPDRGTTEYVHNAAGEVIRTLRNVVIEEHRDARGRVYLRKTGSTPAAGEILFRNGFEAGSPVSYLIDRFRYDHDPDTGSFHPGLLVETRRLEAGNERHRMRQRYDAMGRPWQRLTDIEGTTYTETTVYDALGRPLKEGLAFALTVAGQARSYAEAEEYVYDSAGRVDTICKAPDLSTLPSQCLSTTIYWQAIEEDVRGRVAVERRAGNTALTTTRTFDPATGRIDTLQSGSAASLQNWDLDFDAAGNLIRRADLITGQSEQARYDRLDRLVQVRNFGHGLPGGGVVGLSLIYDRLGNPCQRNDNGAVLNFAYAGRAGCGTNGLPGSALGQVGASPHAVTGAGTRSYVYDVVGNQILTREGTLEKRAIDYDAYDRPVELVEGTFLNPTFNPDSITRFSYASDGAWYRREDVLLSGNTTTIRVGGTERIEGAQAGCTTPCVRVRRQVGAAGLMLLATFGAAQPQPELASRYLLADHLGSVEVVVDGNGNVLERQSFGVLGQRRNPAGWLSAPTSTPGDTTRRGYTGHEQVDRVGIVHFGGRLYDPALGRFIQADPFVEDDATQGLNRYGYVLNNPLTLTDPTGYLTGKQWLRLIATIAINVYMPGIVNGWLGIAADSAQAITGAMVAGTVSGAINGGTEGAMRGAFSAALFFGIGESFQNAQAGSWVKDGGGRLTDTGRAAKAVSHGIAGGIVAAMEGGTFGHAFASAGLTELSMPMIGEIGHPFGEAVATTLLGGTLSEATGGKFANGAVTAAFQYGFNEALHAMLQDAEAYRSGQAKIDPEVARQVAELAVPAYACLVGGCTPLMWTVEIAMAGPWGRVAKAGEVGHAVWVGAEGARSGAGVVRVGQAGEAAVRSVADIGPKVAIDVAGRTRIPDGLNLETRVLSEVKNVGSLSYTQQLRDFAAHASANGLRFDLWVRPNTQLSGPLAKEVANGAIKLRVIP